MRILLGMAVLIFAGGCAGSDRGPTCESASEAECIVSSECTLVVASDRPGDYACVAARNECEEGFFQRDASAEHCESKAGCRFVPAQCYCPPDLVCVCGGGTPAQCAPATDGSR